MQKEASAGAEKKFQRHDREKGLRSVGGGAWVCLPTALPKPFSWLDTQSLYIEKLGSKARALIFSSVIITKQ